MYTAYSRRRSSWSLRIDAIERLMANRIAVICDIHGNLAALEAVLEEIQASAVDEIVVGGDVLPGPMPRETLARLLSLEIPVRFIHGNGELAALAVFDAPDPNARVSSIVPAEAERYVNSGEQHASMAVTN